MPKDLLTLDKTWKLSDKQALALQFHCGAAEGCNAILRQQSHGASTFCWVQLPTHTKNIYSRSHIVFWFPKFIIQNIDTSIAECVCVYMGSTTTTTLYKYESNHRVLITHTRYYFLESNLIKNESYNCCCCCTPGPDGASAVHINISNICVLVHVVVTLNPVKVAAFGLYEWGGVWLYIYRDPHSNKHHDSKTSSCTCVCNVCMKSQIAPCEMVLGAHTHTSKLLRLQICEYRGVYTCLNVH